MKKTFLRLLLLSITLVQNSHAGILNFLWPKVILQSSVEQQVSESPIEFYRDRDMYPGKIRSETARTIEAYQDEMPIGFITYGSNVSRCSTCSIGQIEVLKKFRRKAVGSQLARLAMDELEQVDQCETIHVSALNSGSFWQSLGFEFDGHKHRSANFSGGFNGQESGHMVYYTAIHREKQKRLLRFEEMLHSWSVEYN